MWISNGELAQLAESETPGIRSLNDIAAANDNYGSGVIELPMIPNSQNNAAQLNYSTHTPAGGAVAWNGLRVSVHALGHRDPRTNPS